MPTIHRRAPRQQSQSVPAAMPTQKTKAKAPSGMTKAKAPSGMAKAKAPSGMAKAKALRHQCPSRDMPRNMWQSSRWKPLVETVLKSIGTKEYWHFYPCVRHAVDDADWSNAGSISAMKQVGTCFTGAALCCISANQPSASEFFKRMLCKPLVVHG